MPSRFLPIQAGTDPSQQLAIINKNFAELDAEGTKKLFYDSTGTPSVFIGIDGSGQSVVKVSKQGIDVTTANNTQLAFNSSQDTLKVVSTGVTTISPSFSAHGASTTGTDQATVHVDLTSLNLTSPPSILAYVQMNNYYGPIHDGSIYFTSLAPSVMVTQYWKIAVNLIDISLGFWQSWGTASGGSVSAFTGTTFSVRYYVLQETAA